jgi:hypothetical protein
MLNKRRGGLQVQDNLIKKDGESRHPFTTYFAALD